MQDFYESCLYQKAIRCPKKSVTHCCTGETELERIAKNISFQELQYSLSHSRMLRSFLETHPIQQRFKEQQFEQLCHIKNITNNQNKFYLRRVLDEFQCYKYTVKHLQMIRKQKYDKNHDEHEKLLLEIWTNLMPTEQLENRISNQWITVGFQANDPATDFRGAGYLGLNNLVNFTRDKKCPGVFAWALNSDTTYFFCSAGLFFTMMSIELVKEMKVHVEFWVFEKEKEILKNFQLLYNMLFMEFDHFWKTVENKSILQFNNNLLKFKANVKSLTPQSIKQKIVYWQEV